MDWLIFRQTGLDRLTMEVSRSVEEEAPISSVSSSKVSVFSVSFSDKPPYAAIIALGVFECIPLLCPILTLFMLTKLTHLFLVYV